MEDLGWALADCGLTMLTDARDDESKWSWAAACFAWNLTIACLLTAASDWLTWMTTSLSISCAHQ